MISELRFDPTEIRFGRGTKSQVSNNSIILIIFCRQDWNTLVHSDVLNLNSELGNNLVWYSADKVMLFVFLKP